VVARYRREFGLSERETQVVLLASLGRNCKEIAFDLGCRPPTVDIYWTRIYRKTGCGSHLEVLAALLRISTSVAGPVTGAGAPPPGGGAPPPPEADDGSGRAPPAPPAIGPLPEFVTAEARSPSAANRR
jgi:DNA-binding CsgD family transcriptional regulator